MNKAERRVLARLGAFNVGSEHRRRALWDVESIGDPDDLFSGIGLAEAAPLLPMTPVERLQADYDGTHLTTGSHPMSFLRERLGYATRAVDLACCEHGETVVIAGAVICRQRPGTAKGHFFLSLEDETGIANAIVRRELFERLRLVVTQEPFLEVEGKLQNVEGVVSVLATDVRGFNPPTVIEPQSYDFR